MALNVAHGGGEALHNAVTSSRVISKIVDCFSAHLRGRVHPVMFSDLCLMLARHIDFCIEHKEIPNRSLELPSLIKKVCLWKNDNVLQGSIMVLMISVKNVCQSGWFSDRDSEELRNLVVEISGNFCSMPNFVSGSSCSTFVITSVMSRFYPRMKMGQMFIFLEVKPGFDAYTLDFQISENLKFSPGDKIRLFVVQMDSIETSSCLISPSKVNFLVNGHAVDRRTNLFMDTGPQIPTDLTLFLGCGSNLLQAVGKFDGHYTIAVAVISEMPNADKSALQDYELHDSPLVDSDSDIIEEASRISLNCPISFQRIKTPVKGHLCRHIQCFDFDNYVDINSRRPSWRCPHCNQHVCFTDIRIDQKMIKILEEVGANITNVLVSSDGSWNATQKSEDMTVSSGQNESPYPESSDILNVPIDILDLTEKDDQMDGVAACKTEDVSLPQNVCQSKSLPQAMAVNSPLTNANHINQSFSGAEDDSWSRIFLSTFELRSATVGTAMHPSSHVSSNHNAAPGSIYATSTPAGMEVDRCNGNALDETAAPQSGTLRNTSQLQQYQFGNPTVSSECERFPSLPIHTVRTPVAGGQAPPAHTSTSIFQQRPRNCVNSSVHNGPTASYQSFPAGPVVTNSTIRSNSPPMFSSPLNPYPVIQQNSSSISVRPAHLNVGTQAPVRLSHVGRGPPNQIPNDYRGSSGRQIAGQQMINLRKPQVSSQPPRQIQSSIQPHNHFLQPLNYGGVSQNRVGLTAGVSSQQADLIAAANRTMHMAFDPPQLSQRMNLNNSSLPSLGHPETTASVRPQPVTLTDGYYPSDQNQRPAGRMRGALSGQAFTDAYNKFIVQPNQQAQAARSTPNLPSIPNNVTPVIQPIAAGRVGQNPSTPQHPSDGLASGTRVFGLT